MAEQKAKTKIATRAMGSVSSKPKTTKMSLATATRPVSKKTATAVAEPKKIKLPAAKKAAIPAEEKKAPAKKSEATMTKPADTQKAIAKPTPEERYRMVETAAYFIAERHGFQGRSEEHWAAAEREIAAKLRQ